MRDGRAEQIQQNTSLGIHNKGGTLCSVQQHSQDPGNMLGESPLKSRLVGHPYTIDHACMYVQARRLN